MSVREAPSARRPLTPEEIRSWFDLQRETVERLHPSWLPEIDAELIGTARHTELGRRWLANRLCVTRPLLFTLPCGVGPGSAHELPRFARLRAILREPAESALDLGSLALAARLRTVVNRPAVTRLRTMLGTQRYERALKASSSTTDTVELPWLSMQTSEEIEVLVGQVLHHGAHELAAYAAGLHPALEESVRLSYERRWWDSPYPTALNPDAAAACLELRETDT
jgi:hypothetical protein